MDWVTLSSEYLQRRMRLEWVKLRDAANRAANDATAFDDLVTNVLSDVVNRVRGSVAANRANTLGPEGTVPPELTGAAVNLARVELISSIPGAGASLTDEARKDLIKSANIQLSEAAKGLLAITPPTSAAASAPNPAQGVYGGDTALEWPSTDLQNSSL